MIEVDSEGWVLAAEGQLGDQVYWEEGFETIERARGLLCSMEEIDESKIDWWYLLQGLPDLGDIEKMSFPPLYNEDDFDEINGFLTVADEPENDDRPSVSFNHIRVYIERDMLSCLMEQFNTLKDRLENYKPLEPYL
jgi:hypothetical protein